MAEPNPFELPDVIALEVPTAIAAELALVVGTILAQAEKNRAEQMLGRQPMWSDEQVRSHNAFKAFGEILSQSIARAMVAAGIPAEVVSAHTGLTLEEVSDAAD